MYQSKYSALVREHHIDLNVLKLDDGYEYKKSIVLVGNPKCSWLSAAQSALSSNEKAVRILRNNHFKNLYVMLECEFYILCKDKNERSINSYMKQKQVTRKVRKIYVKCDVRESFSGQQIEKEVLLIGEPQNSWEEEVSEALKDSGCELVTIKSFRSECKVYGMYEEEFMLNGTPLKYRNLSLEKERAKQRLKEVGL